MSIGAPELFVLFLIIGFFILPLVMRSYYPEKLWVGLLLCFISPFGHLYLEGGGLYIIGFIVLGAALQRASDLAILLACLLSSLAFWHRLSKLQADTTK